MLKENNITVNNNFVEANLFKNKNNRIKSFLV